MFSTILEMLKENRQPGSVAIEGPGRLPMTYGRLLCQVDCVATRLHSLGYGHGDRIAVVIPNGPGMAVAFLSIASGFTCAPLNPAYREKELEFYLSDMKTTAVLVPAGAEAPAAAVAGSLGIPVITLSPAGDEAGVFTVDGDRGRGVKETTPARPDDVALLLHTSGTTSRPKLVPLIQSNIVSSAGNIAGALALTDRDKCLNVMPLFHVHGLIGALLATMVSGGSILCTPGYQAPDFSRWLGTCRPTWYTAVPTIHQKVLELAGRQPDIARPASLRFIRSSSAALPPALMRGLEDAFGVPVIEAYGMTEASHQIATNPLPPLPRRAGSVGRGAGVEIAIMGEGGDLKPKGSAGQIVLKGPGIIRGYEGNADANGKAFVDGWFLTGDLGHLDDDGYLYIDARIKEIISRGGEKISPREVEEVLLSHPAVAEVAVFSLPDPVLGEAPGAAVVLKTGEEAGAEDLKKHVSGRLAYFKVPARIWIVDAIPKGPTGKIQRIGMFDRLGTALAPEAKVPAREYEPPATATEKTVAAIWSEVLDRERIGRLDSFFDLGGDSLLATMVLSRINEAFGIRMTIAHLMDCENIVLTGEMVDRLACGRTAP